MTMISQLKHKTGIAPPGRSEIPLVVAVGERPYLITPDDGHSPGVVLTGTRDSKVQVINHNSKPIPYCLIVTHSTVGRLLLGAQVVLKRLLFPS